METIKIYEKDVNTLMLGASFLGTGGGGDPYIGGLMLKRELEKHGYVEVIKDYKGISTNSIVLGSAMMGAPIVMIEKVPGGSESKKAFETWAKAMNTQVDYITPLEIGGLNSTIPLIVSLQTGIPVLDGDGMGRAFPELQMTTFYIYGVNATPVVVFDERGNVAIIDAVDGLWAEKIARVVTLRYGGSAYIALYGMNLQTYINSAILNTLSKILTIGELLKEKKLDEILELAHGFELFQGKVVDVYRRVEKGFSRGYVVIDGLNENSGRQMRIDFQNEFLVAKEDDRILATVPDLIIVLDMFTYNPITTDRLKYGQRVLVVGVPADDKWRSEKALKVVGPKYFGYDIDYIPIEKRVKE